MTRSEAGQRPARREASIAIVANTALLEAADWIPLVTARAGC